MWKLLVYGILLAKCQVEVGRLLVTFPFYEEKL